MLPTLESDLSAERLTLIRRYYTCFNERRFDEAAALFTDDALVEQVPFQSRERGGAAFLRFAALWTRAFPDAVFQIDGVAARSGGVFEVQLSADGTHMGDLAMGGCVFKPTGVSTRLRLRELLEFSGDRLAVACLSVDLQELAHQLARVDDTQLLVHLSRLRYLEDQLRGVPAESARRHDLLDRIGRELDAARHVVRPYFAR
jgi:predicted ester cyclase